MKSIMEEASSIAKAIEKGWARAGKQQEFSVKVFEEPEKNFIGITTKPAKIGLFFQESAVQSHKAIFKDRTQASQANKYTDKLTSSSSDKQHKKIAHHEPHMRPIKSESATQQKNQQRGPQQERNTEIIRAENQPQKKEHSSTTPWSDELVGSAQEWVNNSLKIMGSDATFSVEIDRYALKLQFTKLITANHDKEKMLFRSWAYLIMQALRQRYKRPLKGLKVILMSNA